MKLGKSLTLAFFERHDLVADLDRVLAGRHAAASRRRSGRQACRPRRRSGARSGGFTAMTAGLSTLYSPAFTSMCSQAMSPKVTEKVDGSTVSRVVTPPSLPTSMSVSQSSTLWPRAAFFSSMTPGVEDRDLARRHFDALPQCRPERDVVEAGWKLLDGGDAAERDDLLAGLGVRAAASMPSVSMAPRSRAAHLAAVEK